MAKKDFSNVNVTPVYATIRQATAEPEPETEYVLVKAQDTQEVESKRKGRRTYNEQEAQEYLTSLRTSGRKGLKLPRINTAYSPDVYEYVQIMSRVRGQSMTEFVNDALRQHMNDHRDLYDRAIEFRNSL